MKFSEIQEGDTVRLSRTTTQVVKVAKIAGTNDCIQNENGMWHYSANWPKVELINRPVKTPINWPPSVGDVWEADGTEWFVRRWTGSSNSAFIVIESFDKGPTGIAYSNHKEYPSSTIEDFLKLNPVCLRRRNS